MVVQSFFLLGGVVAATPSVVRSRSLMAHPDMDALLHESRQVAKHLLDQFGEFIPFGIMMAPDGKITHVSGDTGDERPRSQDVIELLRNAFADGAANRQYRATAIAYDVRVALRGGPKTDAVQVDIEHVDDIPATCFLPYKKTTDGFEFVDIVAQEGATIVFAG